jgi:AcrR family transcriptional regulator
MMGDEIGLRGYRVQDPARAEARRREIMLAMAEVVLVKGLADATLEDVAARLGTSRAVIYYQFRSKEELWVEVAVEAVRTAVRRLRAIIERSPGPEAALFNALRDLLIMGEHHPLVRSSYVGGRARNLSREGRERIREADRDYEHALMSVVSWGIEEEVFVARDARLVAYTLMFASNNNFAWRRAGGPLSFDYILGELPPMLLNTVLVEPRVFAPHGPHPLPPVIDLGEL